MFRNFVSLYFGGSPGYAYNFFVLKFTIDMSYYM